jgi:hypothetical protein
MGLFAAIVGALGGLFGIGGILSYFEVIPTDLGFADVTWMLWFAIAIFLLLGSIAISVGRHMSGD